MCFFFKCLLKSIFIYNFPPNIQHIIAEKRALGATVKHFSCIDQDCILRQVVVVLLYGSQQESMTSEKLYNNTRMHDISKRTDKTGS